MDQTTKHIDSNSVLQYEDKFFTMYQNSQTSSEYKQQKCESKVTFKFNSVNQIHIYIKISPVYHTATKNTIY